LLRRKLQPLLLRRRRKKKHLPHVLVLAGEGSRLKKKVVFSLPLKITVFLSSGSNWNDFWCFLIFLCCRRYTFNKIQGRREREKDGKLQDDQPAKVVDDDDAAAGLVCGAISRLGSRGPCDHHLDLGEDAGHGIVRLPGGKGGDLGRDHIALGVNKVGVDLGNETDSRGRNGVALARCQPKRPEPHLACPALQVNKPNEEERQTGINESMKVKQGDEALLPAAALMLSCNPPLPGW
jgi:hypothetical protein